MSRLLRPTAVSILLATSLAWSTHAQMVPGGGGPMAPVAPISGGTSPPPSSCSNSLAFNAPCNSQYLGVVL
jgi:hypothetical protein